MKWLVWDRRSVDASVAIAALASAATEASSMSVTVMIVYGKRYARPIKNYLYVSVYAAGNSLKRMYEWKKPE